MKTIRLNNGKLIPIIGLGTFQGPPGKEHEVGEAVKAALDLGYRHIDCAHIYKNEHIIGAVLEDKLKEGQIKRQDLFIVSKLWNTFHNPEHVEPAVKTTLKNLKLDYLDLYLMHWPQAYKYTPTERCIIDPQTKLPVYDLDADYLDTWEAMEDLVEKGYTKSIGVSNFNSKQLDRLIKNCNIIPAINQIECHAYFNQEPLRKFCREFNIAITAYSPLGSPTRPWAQPGEPDVIKDVKIAEIAKKYGKSPGQILIRFQVQLGNTTVPKSANPERLKENLEVLDFELTTEDMEYIKTFNRKDGRLVPHLEGRYHPDYPFQADIEF